MKRKAITHEHLLSIRRVLPTDYEPYGEAKRENGDCSCGCKWAAWLAGPLGADWCVCCKPGAPREGMLTFEHQAGHGCFEGKR